MNRSLLARLLALFAAAIVLLGFSLVVGPGAVDPSTAWQVVVAHVVGATSPTPPAVDALVWELRLPRSLLALVVGASLSTAGAVTQGLFRNPLAEPGVLGISAAAAMTAVLGFMLGLDTLGSWTTPLMAASGAALGLVLLAALAARTVSMTTLLVAGIALAALFGAITTLMLALGTERWDLGLKVVRWLMGSFEARSWSHLGWTLAPVVLGLILAAWIVVDLDALTLGTATARSLGIELSHTRWIALLSVALLVGAATAVAGVIGFVGLVVPHLARLAVGPAHGRLLPTTAVLGATVLLAVDVASRSATAIAIPPGVITALLGAPVLVWMLLGRERAS